MPELDLSLPWSISADAAHPTAALAARELREYLEKIAGKPAPIPAQSAPGGMRFVLDYASEENDGFTWQFDGREIRLHGNNPRGLLYAVYSFLEQLGCVWFAPGGAGQSIPHGTRFNLPEGVSEAPALPGRCLIIGHQAFADDAADWVIWAARNRLNTIFFHTTTGALALGAVPEHQYQALKPVFLPLMQERGMTLEHGGHGLTELLPRERFSDLPQAFIERDGKRTPVYNFCPSSEAGLQIIRANAAAHFRAHPEVDVFHLWGDDIHGGGWCRCQKCAPWSASEQLLMAINAVADELAQINPQAQISFIAYHDTESVPGKVTPRANVHMLWAPRMRCYGHPVDEEHCRVNVPQYTRTLQDQVNHFRQSGGAPARVFEYYLDAVLFKSVLPPLPGVLQRDAAFYSAAGVHTLQALMTGDYAWTAPQLNAWLFGKLTWNPRQDVDALITQFSTAAYGVDLLGYYRALERAFSLALDILPEQIEQIEETGEWDVWRDPPADMGDPVSAPPELLEEKASRNAAVINLISTAHRHLKDAESHADARLEAEKQHFRLLSTWLRFDVSRVWLYAAVARDEKDVIKECWKRANAVIEELYQWGRDNLPERYRLNFEYIQYLMWNVRLNKIRADRLTGKLGAWRLERITRRSLKHYTAKLRRVFSG
jgi:hypothetical protein